MTKLTFGEITLKEAEAQSPHDPDKVIGWNDPIPLERLVDGHPTMNPCIRVFGEGPIGVTCATCKFLERWDVGNKAVFKCNLRPYSHGPGTDHRKYWPSCDRYRERKGKLETEVVR